MLPERRGGRRGRGARPDAPWGHDAYEGLRAKRLCLPARRTRGIRGRLRVAPFLVLLALLLAQVPWLDCRCEEGASRTAAFLAPDCDHDHHHAHGHAHDHGEPAEVPGAPHDPDDHDHEIVFAVALSAAPAAGLDAPAAFAALAPPGGGTEVLPVAAARASLLLRETGPPDVLASVRLLL